MATRIHSGPVGVVYTDGVPTDIAVQSSGTTKGLGVVTSSTDPVTRGISLSTGTVTSIQLEKIGGPIIAVLGDSILAATLQTIGGYVAETAGSIQSWARCLSNQRFTSRISDNFATSGYSSADVINNGNLANCIASKPSMCIVLIGTNDLSNSVPPATLISNLKTIYTALLNSGIAVIAIPILPRSIATTSALQKQLNYVNGWIRRTVSTTRGMYLADPWPNMADFSNGQVLGGVPGTGFLTSYTYDGLHPSARGGYWCGKAVADVINTILPPCSDLSWSINDDYDATNNPNGNLLTNGFLQTTTGGTAGTGASGPIPSGWTIQAIGGAKALIACTTPTIATANGSTYNASNMVVTMGASPTNAEIVRFTQTAVGLTAGAKVYGEIEVSVSGITADSIYDCYLRLEDGTTYNMDLSNSGSGTQAYLPNVSWSGTLKTQPFSQTGAVAFTLWLSFNGLVTSAGATVKVSRPALRYA